MTSYFLGIDIGATKSHALVADESGRALGFGKAGPGNHEVVGYDGLVATLKEITGQALNQAGVQTKDIAGAGFGVAGYDWASELQPTLEAIGALELTAPVKAVNDTVIGLIAQASEGWGVAVVAGTSNNCWGRDHQGREGHVTGCGSWFGEYGGAGDLVDRAFHAVVAEWSRRGQPTRLTQAFFEYTGAHDIEDFLEGITNGRYHLEAAAAPLVFQVALAGDEVAREVIEWIGQQQGSLAVGVIRQLGFEKLEFEVVLVGSLYNGGALLIDPMRQTIQSEAPLARLVRLEAPPVMGGVLLGMEQAGYHPFPVRERLAASTRELIWD